MFYSMHLEHLYDDWLYFPNRDNSKKVRKRCAELAASFYNLHEIIN